VVLGVVVHKVVVLVVMVGTEVLAQAVVEVVQVPEEVVQVEKEVMV
jgi:hypothetical protein